MNAYNALLRAAQSTQQPQGMQAQPVHHILEEQQDPANPGKTTIVGSTLRQDMTAKRDEFRRKAQDPSIPLAKRQRYNQLANQLEVDIGEEDYWHEAKNEDAGVMEGEDAFSRLQAERSRARGGMYQQPPTGLNPNDAKRKGWIPPR